MHLFWHDFNASDKGEESISRVYNCHMSNNSSRSVVKAVTKVRLGEELKATVYWRSKSYQARLLALEEIRQEYHRWKYHAQPGFQRVYSIVKR